MHIPNDPNEAGANHGSSSWTRRRFLRAASWAGAAGLTGPAWLRGAGAASPPANELLAEAEARIQRHRRTRLDVSVRDAAGRPVAGAAVRIRQKRHRFLFGCNLYRLGRIADPEREEAYRRRFAALFNYATLPFYWASYERVRGRPDYDRTEQALAWCAEVGITPKGHPLVWDHSDPPWLPDDFDAIRRLSHERVRTIVRRFAGRIDIWDVVNEPTHLGRFGTKLGRWAQAEGAVPYVRQHLAIARQANPKATLLVNDYRTDPAFRRILEALLDGGERPFDAVGIQSHMHDGPWPLGRVWEVCDRFASLGLPLHFTETTVVSGPRAAGPDRRRWLPTTPEGEARQADYVPRFYTMVFAHPAVDALTWWDFSDDGAWQGAAAGLVRRDMSPKPVYERLLELIRQRWWTEADWTADADGRCAGHVWQGEHEVEARLPDGTGVRSVVDTGREARMEIRLQPAATG